MMERWRGLRKLRGEERYLALEATAALTATWAGLRLLGYRNWKNLLEWFLSPQRLGSDLTDLPLRASARQLAGLQERVARNFIFTVNCLDRSLTLWWRLRRRNYPAELRVGARKEAGRFEAHAWVELDGEALNDEGWAHRHFTPFEGSLSSMETQVD